MKAATTTKRKTTRLQKLRLKLGLSQDEFSLKYFCVTMRAYQFWEQRDFEQLPGPVQILIELAEAGKWTGVPDARR